MFGLLYLCKLFTLIVSPLHKLFKINLRDKFKDRLNSIVFYKEEDYYDNICLDIELNALNKYKDEFSHIVMGHTHLPKQVYSEEHNCQFINVGDWIHNKSYVVYKNNKFQLIELDEDYNVPEFSRQVDFNGS